MQGQIVFQARTGAVAADETTVNQSTANVAKLPHVIKAVSPFASSDSAAVSKDGTIAYASVSWNVNPGSLDNAYLNELNAAVAPAMKAGLGVSYGAGAGEIGPKTSDLASEAIGLGCALLLLVFMFGSLLAAAVPLLSAVFAVSAGLSLLGLGVAVDYGLFLMARHREQLDSGMEVITSARLAVGTSGAAIVVAGSTVVTSILGLYIAGVAFVGALGLAAAIVVAITMLAALTLVPARMGVAGLNVRALTARLRARKEGISVQQQAAVTAAATHERHEQSAFARWGRKVSERPWPWAVISALDRDPGTASGCPVRKTGQARICRRGHRRSAVRRVPVSLHKPGGRPGGGAPRRASVRKECDMAVPESDSAPPPLPARARQYPLAHRKRTLADRMQMDRLASNALKFCPLARLNR